MKTATRICTAMACATLATACLDDGELDLELAEEEHEIEVGTNDPSTPERNAVVLIGGFCTGTLVAPDVVVTAAHCGWDRNEFADGNWHPITPVTIFFGPTRGAPVATATANQVSLPPLATAGPWLIDDMALLRLTAPVSSSTAIPRPMYLDRPANLTASSMIFQVGYGGGRNRRFMSGSSYRDWVSADYLMNAFAYTPTIRGPGIGDRDGNIEAGDSGGPMLLGSSNGFVMGELSHWEPYGIATFGPGGEGRPSVRNWLAAKAPQKPDLRVVSITVAGCTGTGGDPTVRVRVENRGARTAGGWIDVFHGRTSAPPIGTYASIFRSSGNIAPHGTVDHSFAIPAGPGSRRIDVLLDTTRSLDELNESNNHASATLNLPDCSFN